MCLSLSLFSELLCMAVLVPGLSSRVLGVISPSQDQIFVYFPLFLIYISWFCIITLLLPGSSSSTDDVSSNVSIHLLSAGSASFFILLIVISVICWLPKVSSNILYVMACYSFWMVHLWFLFFPPSIHFEKSVCFGFHGYKPQARRPCIGEHSREYFSRAPSKRGQYHSLLISCQNFAYATHSQEENVTASGTLRGRPSPTVSHLSQMEVKHSEHWPAKGKQRRCRMCLLHQQTRSTMYFCRKHDVGLYMVNCFEKWHTCVKLSH